MATTDQASRLDTINQALRLLDTTDHDTLCGYLAQTRLNDNYQQDPDRLRRALRAAAASDANLYVPYRAAQQVLLAAGQPT